MPAEIKRLTKKYLNDQALVELNNEQAAPSSLEHCFVDVKPHHKLERLLALIEAEKPVQAILFCNSRRGCETLYDQLKKKLDSVDVIHGGQDQNKRTSLFRKFKNQQIKFMIATDIVKARLDLRTPRMWSIMIFRSMARSIRIGRAARRGWVARAGR